MRTDLLDYDLPQELIAVRPPETRDGGRMCVVGEGGVRHDWVRNLPQELAPGDLVVLNNTKVRRARLLCTRPRQGSFGGGRAELLFLHPDASGRWVALGKANRPLLVGDKLESRALKMTVSGRGDDGTLFLDTEGDVESALLEEGTMPIPPYMQRGGDEADVTRYQTVFARELGSAAAPTAGLHLTDLMLEQMKSNGVELGQVTLHVGIGTFRPVTTEDLDHHPMHSEEIEVEAELCEQVRRTRARGGRVVAIGTTAVRALESAVRDEESGSILPTRRATDLLIQPGYRFFAVDALLTNFHQPRSTLLALVSAFVGLDRVRGAYQEALSLRYRFLSYGDAMWIPQVLPQAKQ